MGYPHDRAQRLSTACNDHVSFKSYEFSSELWNPVAFFVGVSNFDRNVLAFDIAKVP